VDWVPYSEKSQKFVEVRVIAKNVSKKKSVTPALALVGNCCCRHVFHQNFMRWLGTVVVAMYSTKISCVGWELSLSPCIPPKFYTYV
jgi:hypothetical protein